MKDNLQKRIDYNLRAIRARAGEARRGGATTCGILPALHNAPRVNIAAQLRGAHRTEAVAK